MLSAVQRGVSKQKFPFRQYLSSKKNVTFSGVLLMLVLFLSQILSFSYVQAYNPPRTQPTVYTGCDQVTFAATGNPYPLCPGTYPLGGNCVWWVWEQWHLLGYDIPYNMGNAASWIVNATLGGFSVGAEPRVGAIAIFPRADGVWAYGVEGHAAFVTSVDPDGQTFDVTYQNYGDPTPMYTGGDLHAPTINQPHLQNGQLRFIYFPRAIDPLLFANLPGVAGNTMSEVEQANQEFSQQQQIPSESSNANVTRPQPTFTNDRQAFGTSSTTVSGDFSGNGLQDLLVYDRQDGDLRVLRLSEEKNAGSKPLIPDDGSEPPVTTSDLQMVRLGDKTVPAGTWGTALDIHIGDFSGSGATEILLYDRARGNIHLLGLNEHLQIKKHSIISDIGTGWELYTGRFDGKRTAVFMYKRYAFNDPYAQTPVDGNPWNSGQYNGSGNGGPGTSTPEPGVTSTPVVTATPSPVPTPAPTATPQLMPTPTPTPTQEPTPTSTVTPEATVTPEPTITPEPSPTQTPEPTPSQTASPEATPSATEQSVTPTVQTVRFHTTTGDGENSSEQTNQTELSGEELTEWQKRDRTANILLLDFDQNFKIRTSQQYTLWHASWEVSIGRFLGPRHDALFLYDRLVGEGRMISFDDDLLVADYQEMHNLQGNWLVSSGDFSGAGRAQMLLYDPGTGDMRLLAFDKHLKQKAQREYEDLGINRLFYIGHFGLPTLSIMFYDPEQAQSSFIGFDSELEITYQYLTKSWDRSRHILIGSFIEHEYCAQEDNCVYSDDILVLNRNNGDLEQYVFAFGQPVQSYDNRSQAFIRMGVDTREYINAVDTTTFRLLDTFSTNIRDQELY